jgi:ribosome recycling factor
MLYNKADLQNDLQKAINYFADELKKIRAGRVSADIIGEISVEAYGTMNSLNSVGQIIVEDGVSMKIQVWDKSVIQNVEKALREANLGAGVSVDGTAVRLKFHPLTEEDRKLRVKEVSQKLEDSRVTIRQVRHKYISKVEDLEGVSEDEQDRDLKDIQKEIDNAIAKVEDLADQREKELLKL